MSACFRHRVIAFFLERKLLNERLAKNMLDWTHSGFSVDASIHIDAGSAKTREALAQYIVRPPVSLRNLLVDEGGTDAVIYRAPHSDYFRTDTKVFPAAEFLVEVLQHLPDSCSRLVRTHGLYSSRGRGIWSRQPHLVRLAPEGSKRDHRPEPSLRIGPPQEPQPELSVSAKQSRAAWPRWSRSGHPSPRSAKRTAGARLTKKVYGADPLCCPRCHKGMKVIAVIIDPAQVLKILRHLIKTGKLSGDSRAKHCESPPPGLDPASLN